jgi:hypothetical protein
MNTAATHINTVLSTAAIAAQVSNVYWELAPEDTGWPFTVYSIQKTPGRTKDFGGEYITEIRVFADSLTTSGNIALVIENTIKDQYKNWKFINATSGYTDTAAQIGYIQLNYNFKL